MATVNELKLKMLDMIDNATTEQLADSATFLTGLQEAGVELDHGQRFALAHTIGELTRRIPALDAADARYWETLPDVSHEAYLLAAL